MSAEEKRTPQDIEADLARTRAELARSVDELSTMIDPRTQVREAKDNLKAALHRSKESVQHAGEGAEAKAKSLLEDARNGDAKAIGILGAGVAAIATAAALLARKSR